MSNITVSPKNGLRTRVITILAGAAAVAYAMLVFVPGQRSIAGLRRQVREKELRISQNYQLAEPIRKLEAQVDASRAFADAWREKSPGANAVAPLYAEVIRRAKETGAEVTTMSPQAEQSLSLVGLVPVAMQAEGTYRSIHALVEQLETMPSKVWVDDLLLIPDREGGRVRCTLKLMIFVDRSEISG